MLNVRTGALFWEGGAVFIVFVVFFVCFVCFFFFLAKKLLKSFRSHFTNW